MSSGPAPRSVFFRTLLLVAGWLSVVFAVLGIFLPVLPTVPLLLLALACFARSSEKFYSWLINHNRLGPIIRPYLESEGLPPGVKLKAILLIWLSIGISVIFFVPLMWVKGMLLLIALGVTGYILKMPVRDDEDDASF
ncbi:MAG: DUF454 domain-containing protein [Desulfuromonas sp.]|nr:MAG: DUF454 domain-containing protein [Desulfuromonas sp.]